MKPPWLLYGLVGWPLVGARPLDVVPFLAQAATGAPELAVQVDDDVVAPNSGEFHLLPSGCGLSMFKNVESPYVKRRDVSILYTSSPHLGGRGPTKTLSLPTG